MISRGFSELLRVSGCRFSLARAGVEFGPDRILIERFLLFKEAITTWQKKVESLALHLTAKYEYMSRTRGLQHRSRAG